jgi:transcriptional regulator GlxA family with amidase domain
MLDACHASYHHAPPRLTEHSLFSQPSTFAWQSLKKGDLCRMNTQLKSTQLKSTQLNSNQTKPAALLEQFVSQAVSLPELLKLVSDWRIKKTLRLIHSEPERDWQCEALAAGVGLTEERFRHVFAFHAGLGLAHYLCEIRLLNGVQLLSTTELTLTEIAIKVGMPNEKALRRAFKDKYGFCPSGYRDKAAENGAS